MTRILVDKIASSTRNVGLKREVRVTDRIEPAEGYVVVGRIHGHKTVYNQIEDVHGRLMPVHDGDVVCGVLGHRNALLGYSGSVPSRVTVGDTLQLLNLGGVIGHCDSFNADLGKPFDVEILGAALAFPRFEDRKGVPAHIRMNAIVQDSGEPLPRVPVIYIAGTCMNAGKTSAACQLIRQLSLRGKLVGGCKLTGVSLRRDALQMIDYGADWAVTFTDAGVVTTEKESAVPAARRLIRHLADCGAEVIVAELGDGIMGEYGVQEILADQGLMDLASVLVLCANDPVGAWGGKLVLQRDYGLDIDVVCGAATDNVVGTRFVERELGLRAINARTHGVQLGEFVATRVEQVESAESSCMAESAAKPAPAAQGSSA